MNLSNFTRSALILVIALQFASCQNTARNENTDEEQQWVYVTVEVQMLTDTTDYFYYGQMDADKVQRLSEKGNTPMFFNLKNIRYWNDSDKLEIYENSSYMGTRIFLTKDLKSINLMKDDPIFNYEKDELAEKALALRLKQNKSAERFAQEKK